MTKLMEWLTVGCILGSIWGAILTGKIATHLVERHYTFVLFSPVIFVLLFGVYAASVVLYRTFTFNNCEKAAIELQEDIKQAREDLTRLGFKFVKQN